MAGTDRPERDDAAGRWTRRGLLLAAAAAGGGGLAACSVAPSSVTGAAPATVTTPASPGPTTTVTVTPPPPSAAPVPTLPERPEPWRPPAGEVLPECKQAAVDLLVAAMSFDDDGRDDDALARRLEPTGQDPEVARPLLGLLPGSGPAALAISYSQYGGLNPAETRASQMVVGTQLLLDADGELVRRSFAADVRLTEREGRWVVTSVQPAFPDPPLPPLDPAIEALLDDERVTIPGIARADLRSGVVHASVAEALIELAGTWQIGVHVFYSAHPVNVFATTRPSAHTVGRAVDVWSLDGVPVIDQDSSPWRAFMEAALEAGATDIGGPEELQPTARYFTDRVHQDHVHLGFPLPPDRRV
ncbi:hypothetical protein [Jannaschia sp. R86511]|uniref:hypothetical protein n=1 Tax=Jannaschia sp. R86511 TaxID=3093853 RepID=UPI0036D24873